MKLPFRLNSSVVSMFVLFVTQTFFLWMFFVAGGLERLAELGQIVGPEDVDVRMTVFDFAARWRHGMTKGWPLYMPGFYLTAIALWHRAFGLSLRRIVAECIVTGMLAVMAALLLSAASAVRILDAFHAQTGLRSEGSWPGITVRVIGHGVFTLISWNSFVLASQFAIIKKSLRPLLIPAALSIVLVLIRPFTVGDFTSLWWRRTFEGDSVAIFSALLIPFLSFFLASSLLNSRHPPSPRSSQVMNQPKVDQP